MSKKPASCLSPDITDAPTPMVNSAAVSSKDRPNCEEDNKVRRSSRIKSLESQRGGRRRREVVFASALSRSLPNLHDDDSSSNSPTESHLSGGASPIRDGSIFPFGGSSSTPNLLLGVSDSKPLKVKSRWRYSSDAESLRSTDSASDLASNSSASMFGSCGSLDEDEGSSSLRQDVFMRSPSLIRKPGHLMFEPGDSELNDKLKKFQGIEESIFRTERKISKESRGMVCDCFLTVEDIERGDEGCNDDCLNRLLMVECGPRCPTGDNCTNKRFQKKEYMTLEVFKTEKKGHGLRTLEFVPEGGFVIEYVGEVLDPWQFEKRTNEYAKGNQEHFYFMALKSDAIIDATVKGNCSRFINHSCEPNCETQKWTVNGELRIGFFTLRDLRPGEEIVFDYQFQRYGKKAQRCFCMTPSCRGWIGEEEEDEDKEELQGQDVEVDATLPEPEEFNECEPEKVKKKVKAPRKKRKDTRILEDVALEEELGQLERTGLKNRHQTLTLSRLMVRAEKWDDRVRLLNILRDGDSPCRRLFLDYRGLKLIHNWMVNLPLPSNECKEQLIKDEEYHQLFLNVLQSLPVPNMTLLLDSKILNLIETWAEAPAKIEPAIKKESPIELDGDSDKAATNCMDEKSEVKEELMETTDVSEEIKDEKPNITKSDEDMLVDSTILSLNLKEIDSKPSETDEISWKFVDVAKSLLLSWADLKEVFRIPKRERVEQMKEHEREADKGLTISMDSDNFSSLSYGSDGRSKWSRTGRERRVGVLDSYATNRQSSRTLMYPNLSKEERRSMFALKVAQEEEHKKQQKMQEEIVTLHSNRCGLLGLDPSTTPIVDISGHYFLDPKSIEWKIINVDDPTLPPELRLLVKAALYPEMGPATTEMETNAEPEFVFPPWPEGLPPPPPLPPATLPDGWKMTIDDEGRCYYYHVKTRQSQWHPPVLEDGGFISMESSGSSESEEEVAVAVTDENTLPVVPKPHIQTLRTKLLDRAERRKKSGLVQVKIISPRTEEDKSSFSKSTIRERKLEVLEEKMKKVAKIKAKAEELKKAEGIKQVESLKKSEVSPVSISTTQEESVEEKGSENIAASPLIKKFKPDEDISNDLDSKDVIESVELEESPTISSPIETELDISLAGTEDDSLFEAESSVVLTKSESSIPGLDLDPRDLPYQSGNSLSSSIVIISKKDRSSKSERKQKSLAYKKLASDKCKEAFRNQIANVVVTHLNPYRKPDCKSGKIVSTEDFKHLARKMTHAILLKELKHSREGKNLEVTDSVKHKTKEYIKKFMGRFGSSNYIPSPEDTQAKSDSKRSS